MTTTQQYPIVSEVQVANCPEDGGKWIIYCDHENGCAILQDTNKARLNEWRKEPLMWCAFCQEEAEVK